MNFGAPHSNLNPGFRSFDRRVFLWAGFGPREGLGRPKVNCSGLIFSNQNGTWAILNIGGGRLRDSERVPAFSPVNIPKPSIFEKTSPGTKVPLLVFSKTLG